MSIRAIVTTSLFLITLFVGITTWPLLVYAQTKGGTTNDGQSAGQVQVRNENGVMYLSNQVSGNNPEPSASPLTTTTAVTSTTSTGPETNLLGGNQIEVPTGFASDATVLFSSILNLVLVVAALLVLFFLISAAIDWITSGGDKGKTDRARSKIIAAIVGIIIVASSLAILTVVVKFLGFNDINDLFSKAVHPLNSEAPPAASASPTTDLGQLLQATPSATP